MPASSFAGSARCTSTLIKNVAAPAVVLFWSSWMLPVKCLTSQSYLTFVLSTRCPCRCQQRPNLFCDLRKASRVRLIGSDCTSGDERSRSVAIQIDTAELVSQTVTLRRPRALLPAIIGCDIFTARKTVRDASPACLLPLPACCHLLQPPATSAAVACFAKPRPEVSPVWMPSWGGF